VAEKTEEPTPRRLRQARKEGDSPLSSYAAQSVAFIVAVALVPATARALWGRAGADLRLSLSAPPRITTSALADAVGGAGFAVLALVVPLLAVVGATGALAHVVQTGGVFAPERLSPQLARLDPAAGLKRLVSPTRLFAVLRAFVAGAIVSSLAILALRAHVLDLARTAGRSGWVGPLVSAVAGGLAWRVGLLGLLLGVLDGVVMRRAWLHRLRMSKEEVAREHRESEGDPHVKAARERAHRELLAQATVASVRTATVVVVNPTHLACALRYDARGGDTAPVVVAAGEGEHAAGIVRAAHAFGIPVVTDVPLARALLELSTGDAIPEALYLAVAEILRELGAGDGSG
jgi:flagellar biosynthesis protein FlhB